MREERIFGPPGTGKTTTLVSMVTDTVKRSGSDSVIVASLTKTAAKEIGGRGLPVDPSRVGTLHSLCYRALGGPKLTVDALTDWNDAHPMYALANGLDADDPFGATGGRGPGDTLFQDYGVYRAKMETNPTWWPIKIQAFADTWEAWKHERHLLDFTDLIETCLRDCDGLPFPASVAFFDEVQDFDKLELALVRKWATHLDRIVLAGDDDQALYAWRGALPDAFLNPPLPDSQKTILRQSYRIPRAVHRVATLHVKTITDREPKDYLPRDADGVVGGLIPQITPDTMDRFTDQLDRWVADKKTVMVIGSCGYMVQPITKWLKAKGYPFHNPYRPERWKWNPLAPKHGVTATDRVLSFLRLQPSAWGADARVWTYAELDAWLSVVTSDGLLATGAKTQMRGMATDKATKDRLVDPADLDRWVTSAAVQEAALAGDVQWWFDHTTGTAKTALEYITNVVKKQGAAALTARPPITVGTIHSVKGGEADVVVLLPDLSNLAERHRRTVGGQDSITRQFYVGMTRAKEELWWMLPSSPYYFTGFVGTA